MIFEDVRSIDKKNIFFKEMKKSLKFVFLAYLIGQSIVIDEALSLYRFNILTKDLVQTPHSILDGPFTMHNFVVSPSPGPPICFE